MEDADMSSHDRAESGGGGGGGGATRADDEWTEFASTSNQAGVTYETSHLRGSHSHSQSDVALVEETESNNGSCKASLVKYRQLKKDAAALMSSRWDRPIETTTMLDGGARKQNYAYRLEEALQRRGLIPSPRMPPSHTPSQEDLGSDPSEEIESQENDDSNDERSFKDEDPEQTPGSTPPPPEPVAGFARIEFEEGTRYISSYTLVIGRDEALYQRLLELYGENDDVLKEFENDKADMANSQLKQDVLQDTSLFPGLRASDLPNSVDEQGSLDDDAGRAETQRMPVSKRASFSSQSSKDSSSNVPNPLQGRDEFLDPYTADVGDTAIEVPPPEIPQRLDLPFWPEDQDDLAPGLLRSISHVHAKIGFNEDTGWWDLKVRGRNGLWVNDEYYPRGSKIPLRSGDIIQISYIQFSFILPPDADTSTETYATLASEALSAMSFDFEDGRGDGRNRTNEDESDTYSSDGRDRRDEESETPRSQSQSLEPDSGEEEENDNMLMEEDEEEEVVEVYKGAVTVPPSKRKPAPARKKVTKTSKSIPKTKTGQKGKPTARAKDQAKTRKPQKAAEPLPKPDIGIPPEMIPPRRKGPGRPPKNGIMSKREEALIKRQVKEAERKKAIENGTLEPGKEQDLGPPRLEKRKYTKRKKPESPDEAEEGILESLEETESRDQKEGFQDANKLAKGKKAPARQPLSPSPEFDQATLTKEQLAKPTISYYWMLYEILSKATRPMSLSSIYHAAQRLYPYFKVVVKSVGWQSSIRHNLLQNDIFKKVDRDGKGWLWGLDPDVPVEREKKRRPSPAPVRAPNNYPQGPRIQHPYPYPGIPNGQPSPLYNQMSMPNGLPSYSNGQIQPPPGHPPYNYPPRIPPGRGFPPQAMNAMPLPFTIPQSGSNSTYQSPYASAPQPEQQNQQDHSGIQQPQTHERPPSRTHSIDGHNAVSIRAPSAPTAADAQEAIPSSQRTFEDLLHLVPRQKFSELDYPSQECIMFFRHAVTLNMVGNANAVEIAEMAINSYFEDAFPDRKHPGEEVYGPGEEVALVKPLLDMLVNLRGQQARVATSQPTPSNSTATADAPPTAMEQVPPLKQATNHLHPFDTPAPSTQPQASIAAAVSGLQTTSRSPPTGPQAATITAEPSSASITYAGIASRPRSPSQPLHLPHPPGTSTHSEVSVQGGLSTLINRMRNAPATSGASAETKLGLSNVTPEEEIAGGASAERPSTVEVAQSTPVRSKRAIDLVAGDAAELMPTKRLARDA